MWHFLSFRRSPPCSISCQTTASFSHRIVSYCNSSLFIYLCWGLRSGSQSTYCYYPIVISYCSLFIKEPAYNPQVEAISPTPPFEEKVELPGTRSSKDELLQSIAKVDREIAKVESQITKLKKKQVGCIIVIICMYW